MENRIKDIITEVLKQDDRIWNTDKTELNQTLLLDLVEKIDEKLIELFLDNETLRNKFFTKIKDVYVFRINDFRFFLEENKIDNSYTSYKNRIGLSDGKRYLKDTNDVVLNFPYKDCVLEGGQSTEEGTDNYYEYEAEKTKTVNKEKVTEPAGYKLKQAKRKEIFYNQILAADEIDRLFDKKALVNWKRYTKEGEQSVTEIKRNEDGTINENLIIKGNNLLALHTLKKQYAGKVKLIYIDPPYNTGNDGFKYNDNFNHSTWLTFMKNRLEIARDLLREDGVIFVQCDDNEQAYLKVLMDEVFKRENFIVNHVYKRRKTQANLTKNIAPVHENIMCYSKNNSTLTVYNLPLKEDYIKKMYKNPDNDPRGIWRLAPLLRPDNSKNREFEMTMPNGRKIKGKWSCSEETFKQYISENILVVKDTGSPNKKVFLKDSEGQIPNTWLDDISTTEEASKEIELLFGSNNAFSYSKPEGLIQYVLTISTKPNDLVLDYHLGSGTTAAVAHKMGRRYIGIEQMDYIETVAVERLKKVIEGEQGGISKSVTWTGGGDFIYFELAKWNEQAKEELMKCESLEQLTSMFDICYTKYFLNYNLKISEFKEKIIKEENFKKLQLEQQKEMFVTMLDNNQMYVQYSEMSDTKYGIAEHDQKLTDEFYEQ